MAVLGSLRRNSFVLIAVIGMALFAFVIAGVFDGNSFQSQEPIGKINGENLSLNDFRGQVDIFKKSYNFSDLQSINSAWDQTVRSELFNQQIKELGINSGKDHLEFFISSNPNFTENERFLNDAGFFDMDLFSDFISELKDFDPQGYTQWSLQESEFKNQINIDTYLNMISSGINSNIFEAENEFLKSSELVDISFVKIPYASIDDSLVSVSSSEISKYIKNKPTEFKQDESRDVQYVLFDEKPSKIDERELRARLSEMLVEKVEFNQVSKLNEVIPSFLTTNDISLYLDENSDTPYDTIYRPKGFFPSNHGELIFNLSKNKTYGPYVDGEFFKISKLLDKKNNGNVRASHILISYVGAQGSNPQVVRTKDEARKEANKILGLVRSDSNNFSTLALENSDGPSKTNGGDLGFFQDGMMTKAFNDFVFKNRVGRIGLVETEFGFHVIKITAKEDLVKVATLALRNIPSDRTSDSIFNITSKFEIELSSVGSIIDVAENNKLIEVKTQNNINRLDHDLPGLQNQRRLVQWLFNEDTSINDYQRFDVSNGGYIIAQLTGKKDEGLQSNELALITVLPILQNQKKAKIIIDNNKGISSLDELAKLNNTEIINVDAINKNTPVVSQAGYEPGLIGKSFSLELNQASDLFIGETGVYMIRLDKKNNSSNKPNSYTPFQKQLSSKYRTNLDFSVIESLKKSADIDDNRSSYY
jgi:peptidyl-prolyl cis-trans isomerase D|tara:strand:- start:5270 stop:7384 length:2115 start_codon:yes stop_codon:yes gene_type:complete